MVKGISSRKNWNEFVSTGLIVFINSFLQIFGWSIRVIKDEDGFVEEVYPVRTSDRSINNEELRESHIDLNRYLNKNLKSLNSEISDLEDEDRHERGHRSRISIEDIFKR